MGRTAGDDTLARAGHDVSRRPLPSTLLHHIRQQMQGLGMETEDPWRAGLLSEADAEMACRIEGERLRLYRQLLEESRIVRRHD